ncbi:MAG: hypothetical protein ACRDCX_09670 [Aeromonas sp.]
MEESTLKIFIGLFSVLVIVIGWFVVHNLSVKRDRQNKKEDIRTEYLISAYRQLSDASNRESSEPEAKGLEKAIHDIQLFGSLSQVQELEMFLTKFNSNGESSLNELLILLRDELRKDLNLEPLPNSKFLFFRWSVRSKKALLRTSR